jgi:diacylglycerol O-acyltransferase
MNFGLLGDFDALPDIEAIGESVAAELAELVELARERNGAPTSGANGGVRRTPTTTKS